MSKEIQKATWRVAVKKSNLRKLLKKHKWLSEGDRDFDQKTLNRDFEEEVLVQQLLKNYEADYEEYKLMKEDGMIELPFPPGDKVLKMNAKGWCLLRVNSPQQEHLTGDRRRYGVLLFSYDKAMLDDEDWMNDDEIVEELESMPVEKKYRKKRKDIKLSPRKGYKVSHEDKEAIIKDDRPYGIIADSYGITNSYVSVIKRSAGIYSNKSSLEDKAAIIKDDRPYRIIADAYGISRGWVSCLKVSAGIRAKRLSPEDREAIAKDDRPYRTIADHYGITRAYVSTIKIDAGIKCFEARTFTDEQVRAIRVSNKTKDELRKQYGCPRGVIYSVLAKRSYMNVV